MEPVYIFDLAARQSSWLSVRQTTIAQNVANADTPGFASKDVEPFREILDQTKLTMAMTDSGHMNIGAGKAGQFEVKPGEAWEVHDSKNSVSLEQEMIKAGEVARSHNLTTSITSSFHGLMLASLGKR
ncbi:flagellar basal body rod protein FlgB [Rhodobacteraceae bacterium RKSG542]|uniref:flagellar basal body rod protein FlgB n=1 Tax=Pseudovibrio flavus TaxID=2529854 RepID=UPI0012BD600A|nr:flagellar basal body rod protein FlgB [Pseudovibrio flavus]MTI16934.1 flagellar basal body rod protein FlgB [Pseudovibrio flavus]